MNKPIYSNAQKPYRLSFTAGGLLKHYCAQAIELYLQNKDWQKTRKIALEQNIVQARTENSKTRITGEIFLRIGHLNEEELNFFPTLLPQEQNLLIWLAICRCYAFIGDFAREVLHNNYVLLKNMVSQEDYIGFFNRKAQWHDELDKLADSSKIKIRTVLFKFMRDTGLIDKNGKIIPISPNYRPILASLPQEELMFFPL